MTDRNVTPDQRELIRKFSTTGWLQKSIAVKLGLCRQTVAKVQQSFGMRPHANAHEPIPRQTEDNILKLLRMGFGEPRIVYQLAVKHNHVRQVMRKYRIRRLRGTVGFKYRFDVLTLRAIRKAIRESERTIAKRFGASRAWLSRFRHRMWNSTGDAHWKRKKMRP